MMLRCVSKESACLPTTTTRPISSSGPPWLNRNINRHQQLGNALFFGMFLHLIIAAVLAVDSRNKQELAAPFC